MSGLSNGLIPDSYVPAIPKRVGVEKSPFQIAAKQLEIDVSTEHILLRHFLALNVGFENRTAFAKAPNE